MQISLRKCSKLAKNYCSSLTLLTKRNNNFYSFPFKNYIATSQGQLPTNQMNPVFTILDEQLSLISDKNFNFEKYLNNIKSLQNLKLEFNELNSIRFTVENQIEELFNGIKIDKANLNEFILETVKLNFRLNLASGRLNNLIFQFLEKNSEDLNNETVLKLIHLFEINSSIESNQIKEIFLSRFLKEFNSFEEENIFKAFSLFLPILKDQVIVDQIQNKIIKSQSFSSQAIVEKLINLFNQLNLNDDININLIYDASLEKFLANFKELTTEYQIKLLASLTKYKTDSKQNKITIKKILKSAENAIKGKISTLDFDLTIELLYSLTVLKSDSKDIFLEIEIYLGNNIHYLDSQRIFTVLNCFVKSQKQREKFLILCAKRIFELKSDFTIEQLLKLLKLYNSADFKYEYLHSKLEDYILTLKDYLDEEDLFNGIIAYSTKHFETKFLVEVQELVRNDLFSLFSTKAGFEKAIEVLEAYLRVKKGDKDLLSKILYIILSSENVNFTSSKSLIQLYFCFAEMKVQLGESKRFDNDLLKKLVNFSRDQLNDLSNQLKVIGYNGTEVFEIVSKFIKIEKSMKSEEDIRILKEEFLKDKSVKFEYDEN